MDHSAARAGRGHPFDELEGCFLLLLRNALEHVEIAAARGSAVLLHAGQIGDAEVELGIGLDVREVTRRVPDHRGLPLEEVARCCAP